MIKKKIAPAFQCLDHSVIALLYSNRADVGQEGNLFVGTACTSL